MLFLQFLFILCLIRVCTATIMFYVKRFKNDFFLHFFPFSRLSLMYTAIIYFKNVVKLCRPKILFNLLLKMRLDLAAVPKPYGKKPYL